MTGVGSALLDWLIGGSALAALGKVALAVCALVFDLIYRRYLGILGADRRKPAERQAYDALRDSLAEGNMAARLYADRLTRFLDWVDRFFGDAGMASRTLFPHAFGLRTPASLWTAPALDRCLLLALLYPILTIFLIWAFAGHVGPAEASLRLKPNLPAWQRAGAAMGLGCSLIISWRLRQSPWKVRLRAGVGHLVTLAIAAVCGAAFIAYAAAVTFAISIAIGGGPGFAVAVVSAGVLVAVVLGVAVRRLARLQSHIKGRELSWRHGLLP